ncbi:hypothetical protein [Tunicatimonas pelagia]|uniref:hypothetical protein n=1 Tax=Tunicatimonas pelagia TaxID=931531 RepID=UPI002666DA66|nr:hypothetical protein [Tunicatimonas pelagia]WKN43481.1 hypothetical protein P0M28_00670 [Tunicatimonas pelagia]
MKDSTLTQSPEISQFQDHFDARFARVSYHERSGIIVCELKSEYVPIEHFKDIFLRISELVKQGVSQKFIFDKRALRAFHQPSMEWYFIVWKKEMYQYGLSVHRKILPDEPWFRKSVEIAKSQIVQNYPDNIVDKLDIRYCKSIEEAIEI